MHSCCFSWVWTGVFFDTICIQESSEKGKFQSAVGHVSVSLAATLATLVGLFGSGEFRDLQAEMEEYEMGKASYVMNLSFTAITWQLYTVGCLGLILEVSSVFSNAISVVGFPIVPILGVIIFHDTMHGLKAISLVLALWGFCSYTYQQYLDEIQSNTEVRNCTGGDSRRDSTSREVDE